MVKDMSERSVPSSPALGRDWRAWAFVALVAIVGLTDAFLPSPVILIGFLVLPLVGSVILANPRFTASLTILAMALILLSSRMNDYPASDLWRRAAVIAITGLIGMFLAGEVARQQNELRTARLRAEEDEAQVRATLDSLIDPHLLLRAIRDGTGQVIDLACVDANEAACLALAINRDDLIGSRLRSLDTSPAGAAWADLYARAIDAGGPLILDDCADRGVASSVARRFDIRAIQLGEALNLTWREVTDRHAQQEALRLSERTFRLLADNSSDVVLHARGDIVVWVSPSIVRTLGWEQDEWIGHPITDFWHVDDLAAMEAARTVLEAGAPAILRSRCVAKDGRYHWLEFHAQQFLDESGEADGISASFRVIDDEVLAEQELERRARFDDLTGVLKRNEALERLNDFGRQMRRPGDVSAVLFIDVDSFKEVNDGLGHAVGDVVLRAITSRVKGCVRAGDTVARMGGDEFLVILDGIHAVDEAAGVAEKIRAAVAEPIATREGELETSVSIGVTLVDPIETADAMIARADEAMYEAKKAGRNQVVVVPIPG